MHISDFATLWVINFIFFPVSGFTDFSDHVAALMCYAVFPALNGLDSILSKNQEGILFIIAVQLERKVCLPLPVASWTEIPWKLYPAKS